MQCPKCGYVVEAHDGRWWCERCLSSYDVRPDEEQAAAVARGIQNCLDDQCAADEVEQYTPLRSRRLDEQPDDGADPP
jgi:hypothetical protein